MHQDGRLAYNRSSWTSREHPQSLTFSVELVNNDHTPLVPPVVRTVMVNVTGGVSQTPTAAPTTVAPQATTALTTAATTAGGSAASVELTAQNLAFDKSSITVPAGA